MTSPPPEIIAERDVEIISVAGRSGDIIKDNGRYKNISISYACAIFPDNGQTLREAVIAVVRNLRSVAGYQWLEDTYNPGYFRRARLLGGLSVGSIVEKAGEFTLTFDCKPQRYLIDGEEVISFAAPAGLYNQTNEIAQPLITVYGTGPGVLTVGGTTVEILVLEDQVTLDCEIQNAYRQVGDAAAENKNGEIYAPDFPDLAPGDNIISWSGGITHVEIIPRWWTL